MTRMVKGRSLVLFVMLSIAIIIAVSATGFALIRDVSGTGDPIGKLLSERLLYIGIVSTIVVAIAGVALIWRSARLSALLDKLVEMNRVTGFSPEVVLNRLGDVGQKISVIYSQMTDLSAKKSRKISALSALNELLLSVTEHMVLVVDAAGRVVHASQPLARRLDQPLTDIQGAFVDDLIPGADVDSAIKEASQTHAPVVRERKGNSLIFNPVIDRDGEVAYLVAILAKSVTDDMRKVSRTTTVRTEPRREGLFRRLARRPPDQPRAR